ncbi:MAG: hypothetical protein OS112_07550 [Methanoregula sp.]|nr:MAG: hypothetical protein OS112_07550 [Methanoregula sp.]
MDSGRDAVRSRLFVSAALRLAGAHLRSAPLTDSPCSFPRLMRHDDAPGLSLRSCAGGYPLPAPRIMLRIVLVAADATTSDAR